MCLLKFFRKRLSVGEQKQPYEIEEQREKTSSEIKLCTCEMRFKKFWVTNWCYECDAPIKVPDTESHFQKLNNK